MRALPDADLLDLWDDGARRHSLDRALLALSAAIPEAASENVANWPLGKRNRALAELQTRWFGPQLHGWLECRRCGEKLEFEMDARSLTGGQSSEDPETPEPIVVNGNTFRLPSSRDLVLAAREIDPRAGSIRIIENCRIGAGEPLSWSDEELEEIGSAMAAADPIAETRLSLRCASCANQLEEPLDLADFVWVEIDARARRLLLEIRTLAAAFGWSESDILALSGQRRARYLELVRA